ncbi:amidohydrolase [Streptomyces sp. NPDC047123]|uniref:amidohydrolase n=1 Tax=Streptomyces sp. NPDC047123 TaxID=3155622 RepID=UPI0033F7E6F3
MNAIADSLDRSLPALVDLYKDLHAHPELAFQEHRTASVVAQRLRTLGWNVTTGVGRTGVVAVLRNGPGPTIMLRADMDALPVRENTGLDYASTRTADGPDGSTIPVMHACGHDIHVTCLIGACALLSERATAWQGTVVAVFQPAEESGLGAQAMVDDGLFERFPRPTVLLGQHVGPGPAGMVAKVPGTVMAAADSITVRLYGRGGHGSKPETTVDPVVMAASLVGRLQSIVSRMVPSQESVVITVGSIKAGITAATIPDEAELGINVRTFNPGVRRRVIDAIARLAKAEALAADAPRQPDLITGYHLPATVNDPDQTEYVACVHEGVFGPEAVIPMGPNTASEDFGVLAQAAQVPSVFWFFGGNDPEEFQQALCADRLAEDIPPNHSSLFAPAPRPTISTGVQALLGAALAYLEGPHADAAPAAAGTARA